MLRKLRPLTWEEFDKDEWLVFPWENYKDAKEDMVNYVISRE